MELLRVLLLRILYVNQAVTLLIGNVESFCVNRCDSCLEKDGCLLVALMRFRVVAVALTATSGECRDQQESEYSLKSHVGNLI